MIQNCRPHCSIIQWGHFPVIILLITGAFSSAADRLSRAGDYLVDPSYGGAPGEPFGEYAGAYSSIVDALSVLSATQVPTGASPTDPNRVFFAPGIYNTAIDSGRTLAVFSSNIALLSTTGNPDDVVITSTLYASYERTPGNPIGTSGSASIRLVGDNVTAYGITFANSTPTPELLAENKIIDPQGNFSPWVDNGQRQAVALYSTGDHHAFVNSKFLGYQDTLFVDGGRSYFKDSYVTGTVDFIFGQGTAVFDNTTINLGNDSNGDWITAASTDKRSSNGFVFLDTQLTAESVRGNPIIDPNSFADPNDETPGDRKLGRPWGWNRLGDAGTVWINTTMGDSINPVGWEHWTADQLTSPEKNGGDLSRDVRYAEYNSMDAAGDPLDVSSRVDWSHQLTANQAADFTVENIFSVEADFPWFGLGYSGSADPTDPNYSWPAFWGDRNVNNGRNNATVVGNPTEYSNPTWDVAGSWDPSAQIAAATAGLFLEADFDEDFDVDEEDLLLWEAGYGSSSANHMQGDANGDGFVSGADFFIWQQQLGNSSSAITAVPEPSTWAILATVAIMPLSRRMFG